MPTLKITEPSFRDVLIYEATLKHLSPYSQLGNLNTYLIHSKDNNNLVMIFREPLAFVQITLPCKLEVKWEDEPRDIGIMFNYQILFQTVHAYTPEVLATMVITLKLPANGEKSSFKIEVAGDKINLPHNVVTGSRISEVLEMASMEYPSEDIAFQLSLMNDGKTDFLEGLDKCLDFISPDERKNNAIALFNDRMVVNDLRHVFIYSLRNRVEFMSDTEPVALHKKASKIFLGLSQKSVNFDASITRDGQRIFILAPNFQALLSNGIASIAPPDVDQLKEIAPTTIVARIEAKTLLETATFLNTFQDKTEDQKRVHLTIEKDNMLLIVQDSARANDINACNVERRVPCATNDIPFDVDFPNDSFLGFLGSIPPDEDVEIYLDDQPSVLMQARKMRIYMSKIEIPT